MEGDLQVDVHSRSEGAERAPLLGEVSEEGARNLKYLSFDEALERVGVGMFHVILLLVSGWALASDSVEIQCISFVTPQLDLRHNTSTGNHKVTNCLTH